MEKNAVIFTLGGIVIVLAVVLAYQLFGPGFPGFGGTGGVENIMPKDEAGQFTLDFIKENFATPDTELEILEIKEASGIYEIKFSWEGEDQMAYVTKDARYLFPQLFDMVPPEPKSFSKTDRPEVDLYVMSFCPFGNQAEELMMPVAELLGDKANIKLHYIVSKEQDAKFSSLHGDQEVHQDIRELCVQKYQKDKFWDFVKAINAGANAQNVDEEWKVIAQNIGINIEQIVTCQEQEENSLLTEELTLTNKNYPVQDPSKLPPPLTGKEEIKPSSSPALVINGMIYTGSRSANGYKEAICSAFISPSAECEQDLTTNSAPNGSCE